MNDVMLKLPKDDINTILSLIDFAIIELSKKSVNTNGKGIIQLNALAENIKQQTSV